MKKTVVCALTGTVLAWAAVAGEITEEERSWKWSPIGIGLAAPIQLPPVVTDVYGLRLGGILGMNAEMRGLDAGLVEVSTRNVFGLQLAGFSWTAGDAYGVQLGALGNVVEGNAVGVQCGVVNVTKGDYCGLQVGAIDSSMSCAGAQFSAFVNWDKLASCGIQAALANFDWRSYTGLSLGGVNFADDQLGAQLGLLNQADTVTGLQLGLINTCNELTGLQIGLINMVASSPLSVMVIANASF